METTVVLLHGYTNCPMCSGASAADLHEIRWNVLAPRYPYHGYADKLSPDQGLLTAEDLVRTTDEAIDIAEGLGERMVVGGLSAGGAAAAWAAQNRPEVDRVVGLAPMVNLRPIPDPLAPVVVNAVKFDEIYPILMDLFTEGEVNAEPLPPREPTGSSAG